MTDTKTTFTYDRGCIVRGPRDKKLIALEFTGGDFAEGGTKILDELKKRNIKASFFFIGNFYRNPEFRPLIERVRDEGHYLGPHSDKHPLYASWEEPPKLLISKQEFNDDLTANLAEIEKSFGVPRSQMPYFIPPYEHWTPEISQWTAERGMHLINFTKGTLSHADYMEDSHKRYVPTPRIIESILTYEKNEPDGLSGFLLLMHIGAGPNRTKDHLYDELGALLDELIRRGYGFVRVDQMLKGA